MGKRKPMNPNKVILVNIAASMLLAPLLGYVAVELFPRGVLMPVYFVVVGAVILQSPSLYCLWRDL